MKIFRAGLIALLFVGLGASPAAGAGLETLFWEDFHGYTYFPNGGSDPSNAGIPEIFEGADEFWYGGRFEQFDGGTINQALAVQQIPGSGRPSPDPVGRMEDEAGLIARIPMGYTDIVLNFDGRLFNAGSGDDLIVGCFEGDLGFDTGANRFRDFYTDDFGGVHNDAVNWWNTEWTEILRDSGSSWHVETNIPILPDTLSDEIWLAFWLDNGEGNYAKIDNIHIQGVAAPEPGVVALLILGLGSLAISRRR